MILRTCHSSAQWSFLTDLVPVDVTLPLPLSVEVPADFGVMIKVKDSFPWPWGEKFQHLSCVSESWVIGLTNYIEKLIISHPRELHSDAQEWKYGYYKLK